MTTSRALLRLSAAVLATLTPASGLTLEEALDTPGVTWQATGPWTGLATTSARDTVDAVQVTGVDDDYEQRLSTTLTGPGTFSLWWQTTAGGDEGNLFLEVDGRTAVYRSSDPFPWEQISVNVPAGTHTIAVLLRPDGPNTVTMVDQAAWIPGQRLPAAVAMEDPDGFWVLQGNWGQTAGTSRNGTGDSATLTYPGGDGYFSLSRLLDGPALVRFWQKAETATPELYTDTYGKRLPTEWNSKAVVAGGRPGKGAMLQLFIYAREEAAPLTLHFDDVEVVPLTLADAVDLAPASPQFSVSEGSNEWGILLDEADRRHTGCAEVSPGIANASAEMRAQFNGPGLLTWSWRKWSDLDEAITVSVNGNPLGIFNNDLDRSSGFAHVARLLEGTGTNSVLWHIQWGDNGWNPMALDDVLFSPPAEDDVRDAIDSDAVALYATAGTPWTPQSQMTHDGADALELAVAGSSGRAALTMPVTGPGLLTWWWRCDLPEGSAFRLHHHGHEARTISGQTGWRQEFLALRSDPEVVRWEVFPNGAAASPSHRVWLDQVTFVPQNLSIAQALDTQSITWTGSGDILPAALPVPESRDGSDALVLIAQPNFFAAEAFVKTTLTGPGSLIFHAKIRRGPDYYGFPASYSVDTAFHDLTPMPGPDGWTAFGVHIAAGAHTVRVSPNWGAVLTLDEVTFTPGDGYALWASSAIPGGTLAGPLDDPDGDGSPNMMEYGFNTLPLDYRSVSFPLLRTLPSGKKVIEFIRDLRRTDLTWTAEVSRDLTSWETVTPESVSKSGFMETLQAVLPPTHPFARVKVARD
ncbi:MAG TPA: hypothetical protein VG796_19255 [Verrucomicrobiales bacterium]|nr:hypothetical protein [Verrucomicrobiales bacterium]